jgi:4a-hydroxytetrahydrobiopterin dehydratase
MMEYQYKYRHQYFDSLGNTLDSINAMGAIAERESHHPDFYLTNYRDCEIILYTHKLQGITENDLVLAEMLDKEVQVTYSPKWLKQHPVANTEKTP